MLSYRLGTVNDFHWEFKPVLSYSKPYTFSTFLGEKEEKERKKVAHQTAVPDSQVKFPALSTGNRVFLFLLLF